MGWRRRHGKRRPTVPVGIVEAFTQHMMELVGRIPPGDILNADETWWIRNAKGFYTRAPRECENVQAWIDGNEKESYAVTATVAWDEWALPLQLMVWGKTRRPLRQLRGLEPHVAQYRETGWQAAVTVGHYLRWPGRQPRYADGRRIVLLRDSCAALTCEAGGGR
jgi:hypothetical protein